MDQSRNLLLAALQAYQSGNPKLASQFFVETLKQSDYGQLLSKLESGAIEVEIPEAEASVDQNEFEANLSNCGVPGCADMGVGDANPPMPCAPLDVPPLLNTGPVSNGPISIDTLDPASPLIPEASIKPSPNTQRITITIEVPEDKAQALGVLSKYMGSLSKFESFENVIYADAPIDIANEIQQSLEPKTPSINVNTQPEVPVMTISTTSEDQLKIVRQVTASFMGEVDGFELQANGLEVKASIEKLNEIEESILTTLEASDAVDPVDVEPESSVELETVENQDFGPLAASFDAEESEPGVKDSVTITASDEMDESVLEGSELVIG